MIQTALLMNNLGIPMVQCQCREPLRQVIIFQLLVNLHFPPTVRLSDELISSDKSKQIFVFKLKKQFAVKSRAKMLGRLERQLSRFGRQKISLHGEAREVTFLGERRTESF